MIARISAGRKSNGVVISLTYLMGQELISLRGRDSISVDRSGRIDLAAQLCTVVTLERSLPIPSLCSRKACLLDRLLF